MCMDDILYIVFYNLFEKDMLVKLYAGNYNTPHGLVNRAYGSFKASTIHADKHILSIPIILNPVTGTNAKSFNST
jgi:hypothetical protein